MNTSIKKIAVLFGGCSSEYNVSLQSAYAIITHINLEKYCPIMIGISKTGSWYLFRGKAEQITNDTWLSQENCLPILISPDRNLHGIVFLENGEMKELSLDAAFPILHGKNGEDGTVQGILELSNIPIIGCGTLCSALCMDKEMAHRIVASSGINVPKSFIVTKPIDINFIINESAKLGYPLFVKPIRAGSSFGITMVSEPSELQSAIKEAFNYDNRVIIEENITGIEVGCAILGNTDLTIGEVDEVELSHGFFNYMEKYTLKSSKIYVPARISNKKSTEIKKTALKIYQILGCQCFSRIDMFLTSDGTIYFNEVNTIPGFTSHSRYPNMLTAINLSFEKIVQKLIEMVITQ